jgi:hypothetical protein
MVDVMVLGSQLPQGVPSQSTPHACLHHMGAPAFGLHCRGKCRSAIATVCIDSIRVLWQDLTPGASIVDVAWCDHEIFHQGRVDIGRHMGLEAVNGLAPLVPGSGGFLIADAC